MKNSIISGILGILIGLVAGYAFIPSDDRTTKDSMSDMNMMEHSEEPSSHSHSVLEIDGSMPVPSVRVEASRDAKDGYNLHIVTSNYKWAPENVNGEPIQGEGHAHIYVNGNKISRLYGEWFNLSDTHLKEGENIIKVTLNANDHSEWVHDEMHIADTVTLIK